MSDTPLTLEEAQILEIPENLCRFLAPEEIAEHAVLPLGLASDVLVVAADPAASEKSALVLRLDHGLKRVVFRPTTRAIFESLLEAHFVPFWREKCWFFPGLPPEPVELGAIEAAAEPVPPPPPEAPQEEPSIAEPAPGEAADDEDHPFVLIVEDDVARRNALSSLLGSAAYEVRFAATVEEVEREIHISPPAVVTVRRDGPISPAELIPVIRKLHGQTQLRVVADPVEAVLGAGTGDDRLPRFLFDVTRFFIGVIASAGGGRLESTEARARYAERAARRMGLGTDDVEAVRLAALFGDLDGHLGRLRGDDGTSTSPAVAGALGPLLDPTRAPYPVDQVLEHLTERFDGTGPRGFAGDAIVVGARVLAAVDRFLDLRDAHQERTAVDRELRNLGGGALDPRAVEAVLRADQAERLVDRLGQGEARLKALVVDPDPVAASLLEMRLSNAGFDVVVVRDGRAAFEDATAAPPAVILSEVAVPEMDGFTLLLRTRKTEDLAEVPFVFVSERSDRGSTMRALELGADDFLAKPVDLELLTAKVKGFVRKARIRPAAAPAEAGVAGDLSEMELVDLLQVLAASGRTARIKLDGPGNVPGVLALEQGRLVDARVGDEDGLPAFHALLARTEGRFTVEAKGPEHRTIDEPLESLLLEACRVLDEASRETVPSIF